MTNRAWSVFEIKSFDDDQRTFEGIATTPSTDRMEDIVEPQGAKFKLPITLLMGHGKGPVKDPVGWVTSAQPSKDGIFIKAKFAQLDSPPSLKEELDRSWAQVKSKLIRGLSIGFAPIKAEPIKGTFGLRFTEWDWLELSVVAIPANQDATILSVKSADTFLLAAPGTPQKSVVRLDSTRNLPGASGPTGRKTMTILEQIAQFEAKRAASEARMTALMTKAGDTGSTLDAAETEEYDGLEVEVKAIDAHLIRLKAHEKTIVAKAVAVTGNTTTAEKASEVRGGVITVKSNLPKGTTFSRWVMAQVEAKGDRWRAPEIAKQYWPDQPEVEMILRAGVSAGTTTGTTWASPLVPAAQTTMLAEFLDLMRPMSIIGRIPGLTRVPANVVVPIQTGGGTGNWVGETLPKPVSALAFSSATLRWAKAVVLTVLSEELIRYSNPNAEALVRNSIAKDLAQFVDAAFVSNAIASVNVSPAGIRWNATSAAASGVTAAAFLTDFKTALATFIAVNADLSQLVILMSSTVALNVSTLKDTQGNFIYPSLNMKTGGNILGIPVVVSEAVGTNVIFLMANEILLADDGGIMIDSSNQASILMDDAPNASPTTTALVSLYQRNLVAIKAEQFITWVKARSTTVYFISSAAYTG